MNNKYITCKRVLFGSQLDEDAFFDWIKKIACIEKFEGAGNELYLDLVGRQLEYEDMKDLIALLYRYKIRMDQLEPLINDKNKAAIEPWKKHIYKSIN